MENTLKSEVEEQELARKRSNKYLIALYVVFCSALLTGLGYLYANTLPLHFKAEQTQNYPIKGDSIVISKPDTAWRRVPAGVNVEPYTQYQPGVTLTLTEVSKDTTLLCFFTNSNGDPVGSGTRLPVINGKFPNETNKINLWCSAGFKQEAHYRSYRYTTEEDEMWKLVITQIDSNEKETELARVPITSFLTETK